MAVWPSSNRVSVIELLSYFGRQPEQWPDEAEDPESGQSGELFRGVIPETQRAKSTRRTERTKPESTKAEKTEQCGDADKPARRTGRHTVLDPDEAKQADKADKTYPLFH